MFAVDHIIGNHSFVELSQLASFAISILNVNEADLQILCTECHDIKTYSEKQVISFKDASLVKIAIKLINEKKDKQFFSERNLTVPSNVVKRRIQIIDILKKENNI